MDQHSGSDPSAPQAFVNGIMEGKEWVWNNGLLKEVELEDIVETVEEVRKKLPNVEVSNVQQSFLKSYKTINNNDNKI